MYGGRPAEGRDRMGGSMLYTVFVAICLTGMSPSECNRYTAVDLSPAPERAGGLACA